jgi:hypothetical protein
MIQVFSKLDIINVRFSNSGEGLGKNYQDLIDNFWEKLGKKRCDYSFGWLADTKDNIPLVSIVLVSFNEENLWFSAYTL